MTQNKFVIAVLKSKHKFYDFNLFLGPQSDLFTPGYPIKTIKSIVLHAATV